MQLTPNILNFAPLKTGVSGGAAGEWGGSAPPAFCFPRLDYKRQRITGRTVAVVAPGDVHSNLPRSKPVERVGAAVQNLMEGLPGYCGRNEQIEKFERVQKLKLEVARKDATALAAFMTEEQMLSAYTNAFTAYNAAPQNGKMLTGLSPDDAFDQFANQADPPIKFSPECRYLLAHHKRPANVTRNGITLRFGKQQFNYRNADTGRLIGQRVLAWFNPELPDILTVTDMKRQNAFCVARSQDVPAMDAPIELLAQELERIGQHQSHTLARYKVLKARRAPAFRAMLADRETTDLGEEISEQRAALETDLRATDRRRQAAVRPLRDLGIVVSADKLTRPEVAPAAKRLQELLADDPGETTEATQ